MRQFAQMVGISNPYLSQIERGLRDPSDQVLEGIAGALRVSADALYEQAGMTPPGSEQEDHTVIDAINADARLTPRQRSSLIEIYCSFVGAPPPRRGRSGRAR